VAYKNNRQITIPDRFNKTFSVGDGVSNGFNGDTYPGTVLFVSDSGRKVRVSSDKYKVIDGLGGYVEGRRQCEFTTVQRPIGECVEWTLYKDGYWRTSPGKGSAWTLFPGRLYSQNPSF
jgi:hypothetical protein